MDNGTQTTPRTGERSRLFILPAELRCLIYAFSFGYKEQYAGIDDSGLYACEKKRRLHSRNTALLCFNRAIHHEARPALYDNTLFRIYFLSLDDIEKEISSS